MIIGIVAISKNFAIGKEGKLPWHHSADLKFFKETTTGKAVVMGATTWRTISKPLPNRLNIVLSRSRNVDTPSEVIRLSSEAEVVELAKNLDQDVFIIGGAQVYAELADVIDKWLVTDVPDEVTDADTFMPRDFLAEFEITDTRDLGEGLRVRTLHRR